MKKFCRIFFSKILLFVLLFVLEFLIFYVFIKYLNDNYLIARFTLVVFDLIIFFSIINKNGCPEFKIPWIVILFLFPYFGLLCYIFFATKSVPRKKQKFFKYYSEKLSRFIDVNTKNNKLGKFNDIGVYLSKTIDAKAFTNNKLKYYKVGEDFYFDLIKDLNSAKDFILMEYFIIQESSMWDGIHEVLKQKVKEGVDVSIMYDDFGSLGKMPKFYSYKLNKEGIKSIKFNPFRPSLTGVHNNRDHRKITVIDGKVAFTGGINIGDEYINRKNRFGHFKDSAIRVEGPAVKAFTKMFLELYSFNKNKEGNYERYMSAKPETFEENGVVIPFCTGPKPLYAEQVAENNFINIISKARHHIYFTTPYLIMDNSLTNALRNAALRGIDVRIITPHIPDKKIVFAMTRSSYPYLMEAGVKIYEYTPGFIHEKTMIVDDEIAFIGTINLDYRSLAHHYECGAILYKCDVIQDIKKDYDNLFEVSIMMTEKNYKQYKITRIFCSFLNLFSTLF